MAHQLVLHQIYKIAITVINMRQLAIMNTKDFNVSRKIIIITSRTCS